MAVVDEALALVDELDVHLVNLLPVGELIPSESSSRLKPGELFFI